MTDNRKETSGRRSLCLEDFWSLKSVNDPQVSQDGSLVAYVVGRLDETANKSCSAIWILNLHDRSARQLTLGEYSDSSPRWSWDSRRLAFVSNRHEKKPQVFVIDLDGGEPRRLTDLKDGAHSPVWSPDGDRICFASDVKSERQDVPQEVSWLEAHKEADQDAPRMRLQSTLVSRFDGRGYVERRTHLFLVAVDGDGREPEQLTEGDCDDLEAAWSPDGKLIAFMSNRTADRERNFVGDVWTLDLETRHLSCLTDHTLSAISPAWSPDGRQVAFYGESEWIRNGYQDTHVWVVSREGGDQRDVSARIDRPVGGVGGDYMAAALNRPQWSPDGKTIYFVAASEGWHAGWAVSPASKRMRRVTEQQIQVASAVAVASGKSLVCLAAEPTAPFELYQVSVSTGQATRLTHTNDDLMAQVSLSQPERLTFSGPDGWEIEGWLVRPKDSIGPDPMVLHVHGGPQGRFSDTFYFLFQALAGSGYASLYINPRGSAGYGFDFARAADWGLKDYEDIMAGVEVAARREDIDEGRMAVTGLSYGGFMTNWVLGHSDRFRAGISVNGISNLFSFYGTGDISALWAETEYGGAFWKSEEMWQRYRLHSPITYVDKIEAPLLLIQSENDYRCPIEQGEQMLTALRIQGRSAELVRVPNAAHVLTTSATPHQRYLRWKLTLDWLDKYVREPAVLNPDPENVSSKRQMPRPHTKKSKAAARS